MKKKQVSLRKSHPWSASHLYQFLVWAGQTVAAEEVSQGEPVAINNETPPVIEAKPLVEATPSTETEPSTPEEKQEEPQVAGKMW